MYIQFNNTTSRDVWKQIYNYYVSTVKENSKYVVFYPDILYKPSPKDVGEYNITINPIINNAEEFITWDIRYKKVE